MIKKASERAQREQRAKSEGTFGTHSYSGTDASVYDALDPELTTEFVGYDQYGSRVRSYSTYK